MKKILAVLILCSSVMLFPCGSVPALAGENSEPVPVYEHKNKQQLMRNIVNEYNKHVLHETSIEKNLKLDNVVIGLKLPNKIFITKDKKVLNTIEDKRLMNTIRYNIHPKYANRGFADKCLKYVTEIVVTYVANKVIERTVKYCVEWAQENASNPEGENPRPSTTPAHPPQAQGFSPGCYEHPNGQVICE